MNIKSIGFSIENYNNNISTNDIFSHLIKCSDNEVKRTDYVRKILISDDKAYYTGLVLTFKNQKKNCKSTVKDGKFVVKVEDLKGDEKLVHFNFFCLKKSSLKGLYLYYHGSCSLNMLFSHLQTSSNEYIRRIQEDEIKALGDKPSHKQIQLINKKYSERLNFSVILNKGNLEKILSDFKEIKSATFRFSSIDFKQAEMVATEAYTKNTDITFNIEATERKRTSPIARRVNAVLKALGGSITKGKVVATDYSNTEKTVDFFNCPTFFDIYDFDEMANKVDGLTNDNFTTNSIVSIIKEQIITGKNKNEFN
ncbi:hypothetical protein GE191_24930 [Serratia fonticola]|uniref:hypothetical protein n=1 Tax=Serratia fonticola TaxID=47917 RepID=UPI0013784755|nr:hypothetical protein [Serratia fonticola]NBJ36901.1 hypothetical protein [Serratia fonticola]